MFVWVCTQMDKSNPYGLPGMHNGMQRLVSIEKTFSFSQTPECGCGFVYCIGAGSDGIAPIPQIDPRTYQPARSRDGRVYLHQSRVEIDEELLRDIADYTGGRYFRVTNAEGLSEVYREIDQLERTKVNEIRYLQYTEHYSSFVLTALSLIATATVLSGTFLRRLP